MAMFHVSVDRIVKGNTTGGATGFAQYIAREQGDRATQHARYLLRKSHPEKDDLVAAGHANLPTWAKDATHFFLMADRYERQGGIVARTYEMALPRELTPTHRQELADDIRATFFNRHPHAWAIHNPVARDGQEQPHVHMMVCERLVDGLERTPQRFFSRAAPQGADPAQGGAKKALYWNTRASLTERRAGIATLTNAALERAGLEVAVSHETLKARGHARAPEHDHGRRSAVVFAKYGIDKTGWQRTLANRAALHRDYHPWENELNRAAWHAQKQRDGIMDLSRAAVVDMVRDRFWQQAQSPVRVQERADSLVRSIARAYAQPQPTQTVEQTRKRRPGRSLGRSHEDTPHGGAQVRTQDDELEYAR